jgi:hypothetical protein
MHGLAQWYCAIVVAVPADVISLERCATQVTRSYSLHSQ